MTTNQRTTHPLVIIITHPSGHEYRYERYPHVPTSFMDIALAEDSAIKCFQRAFRCDPADVRMSA